MIRVAVLRREVEEAVFSSNRYATVVANVLVRPAGYVKQRSLAAIRIAKQGNVDRASFLVGHFLHLMQEALLQLGLFFGRRVERHSVFRRLLLCFDQGLLLADNLDQGRLAAAQGNLVVHHLIFDRITEWSVENDAHSFTFDKSHLYNALTETAVAKHFDNDAALTGM